MRRIKHSVGFEKRIGRATLYATASEKKYGTSSFMEHGRRFATVAPSPTTKVLLASSTHDLESFLLNHLLLHARIK